MLVSWQSSKAAPVCPVRLSGWNQLFHNPWGRPSLVKRKTSRNGHLQHGRATGCYWQCFQSRIHSLLYHGAYTRIGGPSQKSWEDQIHWQVLVFKSFSCTISDPTAWDIASLLSFSQGFLALLARDESPHKLGETSQWSP